MSSDDWQLLVASMQSRREWEVEREWVVVRYEVAVVVFVGNWQLPGPWQLKLSSLSQVEEFYLVLDGTI